MDKNLAMILFYGIVLIMGLGISACFTGWWQLILITGFAVGMWEMSIFWYLDLKKKQSKEKIK